MDTCVGCKACKTECPARIDIGRAKMWWSDQVRQRDGATRLQRMIASFRTLARTGSRVAPLANAMLDSAAFKRTLGIAPGRTLPPLVAKPLTRPASDEHPRSAAVRGLLHDLSRPGDRRSCCTSDPRARRWRLPAAVDASSSPRDTSRRRGRLAQSGAMMLRGTSGEILFAEPSCMSAVTDDWQHLIGDVGRHRATVCTRRDRRRLKTSRSAAAAECCSIRTATSVRCGATTRRSTRFAASRTSRSTSLTRAAAGWPVRSATGPTAMTCPSRWASVFSLRRCAATDAEVVATGTSCRHQIGDLTDRDAVHPVVFLASRLV